MLLCFPSKKKGRKPKTSSFHQSPPHFFVTLCSKAAVMPPLLNLLQWGFVHVKVTSGSHIAKLHNQVCPHLLSQALSAALTQGTSSSLHDLSTWLPEPCLSWISSSLIASALSGFAPPPSSSQHFHVSSLLFSAYMHSIPYHGFTHHLPWPRPLP